MQILALLGAQSSAFSKEKLHYIIMFDQHPNRHRLIIDIAGAVAAAEQVGEIDQVVPSGFHHAHRLMSNAASTSDADNASAGTNKSTSIDGASVSRSSENSVAGQSGDVVAGGVLFSGVSPMPAASILTFTKTMEIAGGLGAGVLLQIAPQEETQGVILSYSPSNDVTIATNMDRYIEGGPDVGSDAAGLGLGIDGANSTSFDVGVMATYHRWFGGPAR